MPTTILYRLNGGEVYKISIIGQSFTEADSTYWGNVTDPSFPDGTEIFDLTEEYPVRRKLGFAKFYDGAGTVRNATQSEIDNFSVAQEEDENLQDASGAVDILKVHPRFRKVLIALSDIIKDEINLLRQRNNAVKNIANAANNFGDFQSMMNSLATQNDRTLTQLRNAMEARISPDD